MSGHFPNGLNDGFHFPVSIEIAWRQADGSLRKSANGLMGHGSAMKTNPDHDLILSVQVEGNLRRGQFVQGEGDDRKVVLICTRAI